MQESASKILYSLSLARAGLALALVFLLLGATAPWLAAQSSSFNTSQGGTNDIGWTRWGLTNYPPTYSFPPDGSGGYAYRIYTPPTGDTNYPALGGSYRADVTYTNRFLAGVDLLAWNTIWNPYAGLLFIASMWILMMQSGFIRAPT